MKYVARSTDGKYLTPRRNTGRMYESRSGWADDIEDAKIFNTANAAKNSANRCPDTKDFEVLPIEFRVIESAEKEKVRAAVKKAAAEAETYNRMGGLDEAVLKDIAHDHNVDFRDILEELDWGRDYYG